MYLPNNAGYIGLFITLCNQRYSEILFYVFTGYLPYNSVNCGVNAISCSVLFVLDLSTDMVNFCGKNTLYCLPQRYLELGINGFKSSSFISALSKL